MRRICSGEESSIGAVDKFIVVVRDSGYQDTPSAVAELVDNALPTGSIDVSARLELDKDQNEHPLSPSDLGFRTRQPLRHGCRQIADGTARRWKHSVRRPPGSWSIWLGLPNSSLTQAKQVTLQSWARETSRSHISTSTRLHQGGSPRLPSQDG